MKKSIRQIFILRISALSLILITIFSSCSSANSRTEAPEVELKHVHQPQPASKQSIMLALLLDTSNSMDGLIDQAKSQLWTIVNELSAAKCDDGSRPDIRIALYEYGNNNLPSSENYIRMVSPLTDDLDEISNKLFALTTNGGDEFCGAVIQSSLHQLDWSESKADLKMIFIAGNEPFTQGNIYYKTVCEKAKENDVVVNTIFCGNYQEGIRTQWKDGADITGGTYMSIEQDQKTVFISTPFDDKIDALNTRLNNTYVYYGSKGRSKKEMQMEQDANAESYGQANKINRAISKSSHAYKNSSWDLVDAYKDDEDAIEKLDENYLPEEMKSMNDQEKKKFVEEKLSERQHIQQEIQELNKKRMQYISDNKPQAESENMLDEAMIRSIKSKANTKNLSFK